MNDQVFDKNFQKKIFLLKIIFFAKFFFGLVSVFSSDSEYAISFKKFRKLTKKNLKKCSNFFILFANGLNNFCDALPNQEKILKSIGL